MAGTNMTATWSPQDLQSIGASEELQLASNPWYHRATASGAGRIRAGGIERDVSFAQAAAEAQGDIDAAYHAKYDQYGPRIVGSVAGPAAHRVTVRLVPQPEEGLAQWPLARPRRRTTTSCSPATSRPSRSPTPS